MITLATPVPLGITVTRSAMDAVTLPEVPVIVKGYVPKGAALVAVSEMRIPRIQWFGRVQQKWWLRHWEAAGRQVYGSVCPALQVTENSAMGWMCLG